MKATQERSRNYLIILTDPKLGNLVFYFANAQNQDLIQLHNYLAPIKDKGLMSNCKAAYDCLPLLSTP